MHCTKEVLALVLSYWKIGTELQDLEKSLRLSVSTGQTELIPFIEEKINSTTVPISHVFFVLLYKIILFRII